MVERLTIEMTPEKLLHWTQCELELARSANAFICEMAAKFAGREKKLREALEKIEGLADLVGDTQIGAIAHQALSSE